MRSVLQEVLTHLGETLDAPVYVEAPARRPDAYVLVCPVGGMSDGDALHPQYALQAWALTTERCEALIRECCDAMMAYGCTMYADPVPLGFDGTHRWWQATFAVHALW